MAATYEPFICGGIAACSASCVIHPVGKRSQIIQPCSQINHQSNLISNLDLAKVRLQLWGTKPGRPTFPVMLIEMARSHGIRSWYSGLSAALMRQAVYGTARIGLHRKFSDHLIEQNGGKPLDFFVKISSSMV